MEESKPLRKKKKGKETFEEERVESSTVAEDGEAGEDEVLFQLEASIPALSVHREYVIESQEHNCIAIKGHPKIYVSPFLRIFTLYHPCNG